VFGYYSLAASEVNPGELPPEAAKGLPRHAAPAVLLARLAVGGTVHGQGLGRVLLTDALGRVPALANLVGVLAVVVDSINDEAARFYNRFGFASLPGRPNRLFLPVDAIRPGEPGS
jgi:predicted N-acetyltransferase YhbS